MSIFILFSKFLFTLSFLPFFSANPLLESNLLKEHNFFEPAGACQQPSFTGSRVSKLYATASDVVSADFNNDGRPDIATIHANISVLAVQLNIGNGLLGEPRVIANPAGGILGNGDFNNDGNADLLTAGNILFGDGTGNFSAPQTSGIRPQVVRYTVGDFNGDDNLDVAGLDGFFGPIVVHYGDGAGNFGNALSITLSGAPNTFDVNDYNADGLADIAVILDDQNIVSIVFGNADRTFQTPVNYPVGAGVFIDLIATGDINGDGSIDIFTTSNGFGSGDTSIVRLINNGSGGFTALPRITEPTSNLRRIALVDLNSDGKSDYVASFSAGWLLVRFGNGDGTFQESRKTPGITAELRLLFSDFTGDGKIDVGEGSSDVNAFAVLVNNFPENLGVKQFPVTGYTPVAAVSADFNEDGNPDVVTANNSLELSLSFGNGAGGFGAPTSFPLGKQPRYAFAADVNNDGNSDMVALVQNPGDLGGIAFVFLGNGNGTFQNPVQKPLVDVRLIKQAVLKDINNDGFLDLIVPRTNTAQFALYRGLAGGQFADAGLISPGATVTGITAGDFNQDGNLDLAVLSSGIQIYLGNGNFGFNFLGTFPARFANSQIFTADFNSDGILDLTVTTDFVSARGSAGFVGLLLGVGNGGFRAVREYGVGRGPSVMGAADFNGDGKLDLAVTNPGYTSNITYLDHRISVLYGDGQGDFPDIKSFIAASTPQGLAIGDFNSDNNPDIVTAESNTDYFTLLTNTCLATPNANLPQINAGSDVSVNEGDASNVTVNLTVTLSASSTVPVRVKYQTASRTEISGLTENGLLEAAARIDYQPIRGELLFQPGETSKNLQLSVKGDLTDEFDENLLLILSDANNGVVGDGKTEITIIDNDAPPVVSIGDVTQPEGNSGSTAFNFPITLSAVSGKPVSVVYNSGGGTATANNDYTRAQGVATIPAGQIQSVIPVNVIGDLNIEPNETFQLEISQPVNASIGDNRGLGTISNDDEGGVISLSTNTYSVNEGDGLSVTINRTGGNGGGASVRFRTQPGTATPGQDYLEISTVVTFNANETSKTVTVVTQFDQLDEATETVNLIIDSPVNASVGSPATAVVNILDGDDPPSVSISDASVVEGNSGNASIRFTLTLSRPSKLPVTVNYATADGTATGGSDYVVASGQFTIPPGSLQAFLNLSVIGDTAGEPDETFFVNLTNPVNGTILDGQGVGTIVNDEVNSSSGVVRLVSYNAANTATGNADSGGSNISDDGRFVTFSSFSTNLGVTDVNGAIDIFVRDIQNQQTKAVSLNQSGSATGNCTSRSSLISGDGKFIAFESCATDLIAEQQSIITQSVFLRNLQTNETKLISISSGNQKVNGRLLYISTNGRYVLFSSPDQNITPIPDTQGFNDVFVRDTLLNTTTLVSVNSANNAPGNANSGGDNNIPTYSKITNDGRYVIFSSEAGNLVSQTNNSGRNIFVRDLQAGVTIPVSVNQANTALVGADSISALSDDGRYAYFTSGSSAIAGNDTNNSFDVYRRDLQTNSSILVSVNAANTNSGNAPSAYPQISADGRFVAFDSSATNLQTAVADSNQTQDVYLRDMQTGVTRLISVNNNESGSGNQISFIRDVSADGKNVLFCSAASNLVSPTVDTNGTLDLFLRDAERNVTAAVSANQAGTSVGNQETRFGTLAANGKYATFDTYSNNIVPFDTNNASDSFWFSKNPLSAADFDFDGDGRADIGVFRPSNGGWYIQQSTNGFISVGFGLATDKISPADYDGDGKTDLAVYRDGVWYLQRSTDGFLAVQFGSAGDIPQPADFSGDGKAELAIYRPSNGVWYVLNLATNQNVAVQFGVPSDKPVVGDYDGDGKADYAVFRPENSVWYILQSNDGFRAVQWGVSTDKTVPADYDGDGKTDIGVFRPSNNTWYISNSGGGATIFNFGLSDDLPTPADYDGDGRADIGVFRPSNSGWYIQQSTNGFIGVLFGAPNDQPIENAFIR